MHTKLIALSAALLAGCAMTTKPYPGYLNPETSVEDSAVFSAYDDHGPTSLTVYITSVDGKPYEVKAGHPGAGFWLRLSPGKHAIGLRYMNMNNGTYSYQNATSIVELDMNPKTFYVARVSVTPEAIKVTPTPLPLSATYKFPAMHEGKISNLFSK